MGTSPFPIRAGLMYTLKIRSREPAGISTYSERWIRPKCRRKQAFVKKLFVFMTEGTILDNNAR
jgi:hypothetical protein